MKNARFGYKSHVPDPASRPSVASRHQVSGFTSSAMKPETSLREESRSKRTTQTFWFFEDEIQRPLSQMECERILGYIKEYGEDETLDALRDASIEKKVKWPYIEAILRNRKKEAQA